MIRTFRGSTNSWYLSLRAIKLLAEVKQTTCDSLDHKAINLNIIQNLASAVEGSTRSLLINHIEYSNNNKEANKNVDLGLKALIDITLKSLYKASWRELNSMAYQLFGANLNKFYSGDIKTITNLFHLRNVTAHGGVIIKKIDFIPKQPELGSESEEDRIDYDNKIELRNYLIQKELISSKITEQIRNWDYFNDNISDHFEIGSFGFIKELYLNYIKNYDACKQIKNDLSIIKEYCDR